MPDEITPDRSGYLDVAEHSMWWEYFGAHDRAIPLWQQEKLAGVFPNSRYQLVPDSGHVIYLERPDIFFPALKRFMAAKSVDFEMPAGEDVA